MNSLAPSLREYSPCWLFSIRQSWRSAPLCWLMSNHTRPSVRYRVIPRNRSRILANWPARGATAVCDSKIGVVVKCAREDLQAEILTGFLAAVAALDLNRLDEVPLASRLCWSAWRAGHAHARAEAGYAARRRDLSCQPCDDAQEPGGRPALPWGHPDLVLALYQQAGTRYGIAWTLLAAIGTVESGNGKDDGPSTAGALGPMQFLPSTWATYGDGGNIENPADAIPASARYLLAAGAPANITAAIFAYNHSAQYVTLVLHWAVAYTAGGAQALAAAASPACQAISAGPLPAGAAGKILAYAEAQLGKPYQWGGTGPDAFDCSGLAMMAYRTAGIYIPRTSQQQWAYGRQIPASQVRPGDLVFYIGEGDGGTEQAPGHVAIIDTWNGTTGTVIVAPESGQLIQVQQAIQPGLVGFTDPAASRSAIVGTH
jgi:cell wall-associated NlpC family hydrolase